MSNETKELKRIMGLLDGIAIIMGVIIGSGIFISPKGIVMNVQSVALSLMVWAMCGISTMFGALSYAELGTQINKSGAEYAYILHIFGNCLSFLVLWTSMLIIMPSTQAIIALTFSKYIVETIYHDCTPPSHLVTIFSILVVCFIGAINSYSVKISTSLQKIFLFAKIFALIAIICLGIYSLSLGNVNNIQRGFENSRYDFGSISLALYSGLFSFGGWTYLNYVTEELKEPKKNLPRAIIISMLAVTILYVLVNISYFIVLSPLEIINSNAVGVTFINKFNPKLAWIMTLCVALSTFGSLNGCILASSRLYFVAARNGHMPSFLATINVSNRTPICSLIFVVITTLIMIFIGDVYTLINYALFPMSLFYGTAVLGLFKLRKKIKLKVHISIPTIFVIVSLFLIIVPLITVPYVTFVALCIIISGLPIYFISTKIKKESTLNNYIDKVTIIFQKLLYSVESKNK